MNILINMEMPQRGQIILIYPDGNAALFARDDINILDFALKNVKAIPVPPHGRLIDADALCEKDNKDYEDAISAAIGLATKTAIARVHIELQKIIYEAPTIIPADKETTE